MRAVTTQVEAGREKMKRTKDGPECREEWDSSEETNRAER